MTSSPWTTFFNVAFLRLAKEISVNARVLWLKIISPTDKLASILFKVVSSLASNVLCEKGDMISA